MGSRITFFEVEILDWKTKQQLCFLEKVEPHATISDIRLMFHKLYPQWYPARQSIRLEPKGKSLRDEESLQLLPLGTTATFYFKDLGPQVGWTMVFLIEYTGPLFIYFVFYFRMPFIYGLDDRFTSSRHPVVNLACICHSFHYIKRLIETIFVHRFSHGTMPLRSIVKNCFYYWGFAAWLAYYINHPLYTPPSYGQKQVNFALIMCLDPRPVRFLIQQRILSHGYSILYPALTIPMSGIIHLTVFHSTDGLGKRQTLHLSTRV
ncbi:very-long-chain enoyl-CoA reductase-like isoform X3 [Heteronotia binoei]|uniref:very-long-chain enoyl-CoA reductase-like isoform X3 n=1 Tax=Heteronotia binoei TaxID=13085 RepID=UPI00292E25A9|nr:very-long-chain enoyl-CoA reductase-like isoform X3 [Heteronotia binoei]